MYKSINYYFLGNFFFFDKDHVKEEKKIEFIYRLEADGGAAHVKDLAK